MRLSKAIILILFFCAINSGSTFAASLSQNEAEDLVNDGIQFIQKQEPLAAIRNFEKVLLAYPNNAPTQYYAAMALGALGEIDAASAFYKEAVVNGYRGEQTSGDVVGDLLKQYEPREFDVEYSSIKGGIHKVHVIGNPGGDDELIKDTLTQIDKMSEIFGIVDFRNVTVRFLRWINSATYYEKWTVASAEKNVDVWVTINTKPPADFPSRTQIGVADSNGHPASEDLKGILQLILMPSSPSAVITENIPLENQQAAMNYLPGVQDPELERARILVNERNCVEALPILEAILAKDPRRYEAYLGRAACNYDNKEYSLAVKDYYKALELRPEVTEIYKSIATIHLTQKNIPQAEGAFYQYLKYFPNDGEAWYSLAWLTQHTDDLERAEQLGIKDTLGLREVIEKKKIENDKVWEKSSGSSWVKGVLGLLAIFGFGLFKVFITPVAKGSISQEDIKISLQKINSMMIATFIGATIFNAILLSFAGLNWTIIFGVYVFCGILAAFLYAVTLVGIYKGKSS